MNLDVVKTAFWTVLINYPKDETRAKEYKCTLCALMYNYFLKQDPSFITRCTNALRNHFKIPQETFENLPLATRKQCMYDALEHILTADEMLTFYKHNVKNHPTAYCDDCGKYFLGKCKCKCKCKC